MTAETIHNVTGNSVNDDEKDALKHLIEKLVGEARHNITVPDLLLTHICIKKTAKKNFSKGTLNLFFLGALAVARKVLFMSAHRPIGILIALLAVSQ
jgi:uncharacterized membrane protein YGL010W